MIDVKAITDLHIDCVRRWHEQPEPDNLYDGFLHLVCQQHTQNYLLWHEEDIARSREVGYERIAQVKRNIDALNQRRNDLIETLDGCLIQGLEEAGVRVRPYARLNTETPGSVIDRLSILALRMYHLDEQTRRDDVDDEFRQSVGLKLAVCREQHADLSASLADLLEDIFAGRKRLKVYRQFKMYNDPRMNPWLYRRKPTAA